MAAQGRRPRPGVRQVAERAGVSIATISRVINNSPHVNAETRGRVLKAMGEVNYRVPRYAARRSGRLAVLLVSGADAGHEPGSEALLGPLQTRLAETGYEVMEVPVGNPDTADHLPEPAASRKLCGILALGMDPPPFLSGQASFVPAVTIGMTANHATVSAAVSDNTGGAAEAVRHLLDLGHRRILLLAPDCGLDDLGSHMQTAYRHEHRVAGVAVSEELICKCACNSIEAAEKVRGLLSRGVKFTAVYGHFRAIIGARQAVMRHGLAVPGDVSLIAHWDAPFLADLEPPVDAIGVDVDELVTTGIELLEGRMIGRYRQPVHVVLPMKHVPRGTIAPPIRG
jgi:DNA-binding LacI/PurR family transcriptional regulator